MDNNSIGGGDNYNHRSTFQASGLTYVIVFVIAVIFFLLTLTFACIRLRMSRTTPNLIGILAGIPPSQNHARQNSTELMEQGLHQNIDTSYENYPKLLYSQIEDETSFNSGCSSSSCSICLGDYKENDTLRLLPECGHVYHVACVDPWLRLHSTCPICRKSSLQSPSQPSH